MKQNFIDEITTLIHKASIVTNLARKKFVSAFVIALTKSRNVQFCEVAHHLNDTAKLTSNENRIQDFFREVDIDYTALAILLISLLPREGKLRLCLDRTEWDFGTYQANVLMLLVGQGDMHIPLFWVLLDNKSGNSNTDNRIDLLEKALLLLGKERIGLVVGDREFVGHKWIKYLKDNQLFFVMRFPKHHLVSGLDGHQQSIEAYNLAIGQVLLLADCMVDGIWGHGWIKRLDEHEYLYLFGTAQVSHLGSLYRKRWTIETCFQALKGRGFNLESTHLQCSKKLSKLVALVSLTYAFCFALGAWLHHKVQKIKTKNHGYKANTFSRYGLNRFRELTRPKATLTDAERDFLPTAIRWIKRQLAHYQALKIVG